MTLPIVLLHAFPLSSLMFEPLRTVLPATCQLITPDVRGASGDGVPLLDVSPSLDVLADDVAELGFVEAAPKQDGRNMIMVLAPHKAPPKPRARTAVPDGASTGPDASGAADAQSSVLGDRRHPWCARPKRK